MYDRLLVPLDGTSVAAQALDAADRLARHWGSKVQVITLLHDVDEAVHLDERIREQVARLDHGDDVEIRPLSYSVAEDIAATFDEVENTLVVMNTDARGRMAALTGNVAEEVMRHIRRPMVLLGPDVELPSDWPDGPLLTCTDGSDFAESISALAIQWCNSLDLEPMLVTVVDLSKVPAGISLAGESNSVARLAGSMGRTSDRPINYDVLHGDDAAKSVVDYANHHTTAMIAMATHGRSGVQRAIFGSVTMAVVRGAHCPVLVNRPPVDTHR